MTRKLHRGAIRAALAYVLFVIGGTALLITLRIALGATGILSSVDTFIRAFAQQFCPAPASSMPFHSTGASNPRSGCEVIEALVPAPVERGTSMTSREIWKSIFSVGMMKLFS
jgi:hypothetical protein